MLKLSRKIKGQSTLEYAVLIIIIIGALLTIQAYVKRGIQGRLRSASDDIGDQFDPGNTNLVSRTITTSTTNETFQAGVTSSTITGADSTNVVMDQFILNNQRTFWGGN